MTYEDLRQKIEDKKRRDYVLEKVKSIMKMIVAIVMSFSSLKIIKALNEMVTIKLSTDSIYLEKYFRARTIIRKRRHEQQKNFTDD